MNPPSERQLLAAERALKKQRPGAQKAVGGGIYMRLDKDGRRRFQFRLRSDASSSGQPAATKDSWQAAYDARLLAEQAHAAAQLGLDASKEAMRGWDLDVYAEKAWWPDCTLHLDILTRLDYRNGLKFLLPHIKGVTLGDLEDKPLLVRQIQQAIAAEKTYPNRDGKVVLHKAAADKPLNVLSVICEHAADSGVLVGNPTKNVRRLNSRRGAAASNAAPSHRPILRSDLQPHDAASRAGSGMRGDPVLVLQRRLMPELIIDGLRPSDILAMRHSSWRDKNGARERLRVESAVKDLAGYLIEGEPKTGVRDLYLPPAIAEWLEWLYQLQGCPDLESLVFPNRNGGLLDWGNYRDDAWYPALHRAGISDAPTASATGAYDPYQLRHVGVTLMAHAERPEGGTYARHEVAFQFGHTVGTLDRVYLHVLTGNGLEQVGGRTLDEIIRNNRRRVWGAMPGDPDHQEVEYDLLEAADLTGITHKALAARIQRGSIPSTKRRGKYYVTRFDLAWHGLLPPELAEQRSANRR